MKILGVIPARFASTRFPGKPLVDIAGKTMIQRVYEKSASATTLNDLVVATDDQRIHDAVKAFDGNVVMTSSQHQSGTDRCAEVAEKITGYDAVINIQGDEPLVDPNQINLVAACFNSADTQLATLVKVIRTAEELFNHNTPKVLLNTKNEALYFSRETVPFLRNYEKKDWLKHHTFYKHIGIYGYTVEVLKEIAKLSVSSLEKAEALEQLRWLESGYRIKVSFTDSETLAIDTPEDLEKVLAVIQK